MNFNKQLADKIFTTLQDILPLDFGIVYDDYEDLPFDFYNIREELQKIDSQISLHFGASKLAIASPNLDNAVIKIPFNGNYNHGVEYYNMRELKEAESLPFDSKFTFNQFGGGSGRYNDDYCISEMNAYNELKEYGYEKFVAETQLLGWIDGKCILIQEYVTPEDLDTESHHFSIASRKTSQQLKKEFDSTSMMSEDWVAALIEHYGESLCREFFDYCEEDGYSIVNDAHGMNYGYREDGSPAILDFSDFCN